MSGFLCSARIYEFDGQTFEFNEYTGPWPIRKDGERYKRAGKKFYDLFDQWYHTHDRESFRVGGGCERW